MFVLLQGSCAPVDMLWPWPCSCVAVLFIQCILQCTEVLRLWLADSDGNAARDGGPAVLPEMGSYLDSMIMWVVPQQLPLPTLEKCHVVSVPTLEVSWCLSVVSRALNFAAKSA